MLDYSLYSIPATRAGKGSFSLRRAGFIFLGATTGLLIVLLTIDWAKTQSVFDFKNILVKGNDSLSETDVKQLAKIDAHQSVFDIDLKSVENKIAKHQLIKEARVSRRLPNAIMIEIVERKPLATINGVPIDDGGILLTKLILKEDDLYPTITDIKYTGKINGKPEMKQVLSFLDFAKNHQPRLYQQISRISFSESHGIYFFTQSNIKVIVGGEDFVVRASNLVTVMSYLTVENNNSDIDYFDLRFNQQVIVKATGKW
jgi:cell division protein FtsQ